MFDFIWESLLSWIQNGILSSIDLLGVDMLYAFSPSLITMDKFFPFLNDTYELITECSLGLILFLCIFKVFQNFFLVFTKNYEAPFYIVLRTVFAFVGLALLPQFLYYLFTYADTMYWSIMDAGKFKPSTGLFTGMCNMLGNMFNSASNGGEGVLEAIGTSPGEAIDYATYTPLDIVSSLPAAILSFVLTVAIAWNYFKLILEIAERYVVLGVMYYTMPLAVVPMVSRETSKISAAWLKMLVSELLILVLNVYFVAAFKQAVMYSSATVHYEVNGHMVGGAVLWSFVALAFLKTAQKIDSHMAALGLTTVQLGSGVAGTIAAAGGFAMFAGRSALKGATGKGGVFAPGSGSVMDRINQAKGNMARQSIMNSKGPVSDASKLRHLSPSELSSLAKSKGFTGEAAAEYARKMVPNALNGKNISEATVNKDGGFNVKYKDANGKDAMLSFSAENPGGVSKMTKLGDVDGFLKDTGTPYNFDDANSGDMSFADFADQHLNGSDNFVTQSGHFSPNELENATISADPNGDGLIIKDQDGYEMAHISPFNDEHSDGLTNNTLIGEGSDGLYRADFNTEPKIPLPEGYSYAGECMVDSNGNPSNPETGGGVWQDSYITPDGKYISSDDMNDILHDSAVVNSDYAGNLNYDSQKGFVDNDGNSVSLDKTGWESTDTPGTYQNSYTGGIASGEQVSEHMSNPQYATQTYGGIKDGEPVYFDNYSKDTMSPSEMNNAVKYGELPDGMNDYYNSNSGEFGSASTGAKNFGESVEGLLDKDYSFSGRVGANVAKAYIPDTQDQNIVNATVDKDNIVIAKENMNTPGRIDTDRYWSGDVTDNKPGSYEQIQSNGNVIWSKPYSATSRNSSAPSSDRNVFNTGVNVHTPSSSSSVTHDHGNSGRERTNSAGAQNFRSTGTVETSRGSTDEPVAKARPTSTPGRKNRGFKQNNKNNKD
jgi:hypothetical protein